MIVNLETQQASVGEVQITLKPPFSDLLPTVQLRVFEDEIPASAVALAVQILDQLPLTNPLREEIENLISSGVSTLIPQLLNVLPLVDTLKNIENVLGSNGNDTIIGDRQNNVFTGNGGLDLFTLTPNHGIDTITDFTIGEDQIQLTGGLTFAQLDISQGTGENGNDTLIRVPNNNNELLAVLKGVIASALPPSSFMLSSGKNKSLTGLQKGSDQVDSFTALLNISSPDPTVSETTILNANIQALGGNDAIEGIISIQATQGKADALAMSNSLIDAGEGNDRIYLKGDGTSQGENATGTGYGVSNGSILGGGNNDIISISGNGKGTNNYSSKESGVGYGISHAFVDGGTGEDTISIAGSGIGTGFFGVGTGYGINSGSVVGGTDKDSISISGIGTGNGREAKGTGYGMIYASIEGGSGEDTIALTGTGTADGRGAESFGYGLSDGSVKGGDDKDTISITGIAISNGQLAANSRAYGLFKAKVEGGSGGDTISITGTASRNTDVAQSDVIGYGMSQASIEGGSGGDTISITGTGTGGRGFGAYWAPVSGGSEDDIITIKGEGTVLGIGVFQSSITGDDGKDEITTVGTNFGIQDALIDGGAGDDTLNVGRGRGTVNGGGNDDLGDTLVIDYFSHGEKPADIKVSLGTSGSILISGQFDNVGNASSWSQTILNVEQFQVGSSLYSASSFINQFS